MSNNVNWKNLLMQVLDAVGQAEGVWFEGSWDVPDEVIQQVNYEYNEWLKITEAARLHNEAEMLKVREAHGPAIECCCWQLMVGINRKTVVDCQMHGEMDYAKYEPVARTTDFIMGLRDTVRKWYEDRGAKFVEEKRTPPPVFNR